MPTVRAAALLAGVATVLAACATSFNSEPPAGVSLAGHWKLDPAASDDPQKVLDKMRAEAFKLLDRRNPPPLPAPSRPGHPAPEPSEEEAPPPPPPPGAHRPDPLRRSPMANIIRETVQRGDFLTIREGADEFVLDYGTSRRSFTPGLQSVVSAQTGVGDQTSGWKGHQYVIRVKSQTGPDVLEEYSLAAGGKELVMKLHLSSGELPSVDLTRIYRPTTEAAPQMLPSND